MAYVSWGTNGGICKAGPMPQPWALKLQADLLAAGYRDAKLTTGN